MQKKKSIFLWISVIVAIFISICILQYYTDVDKLQGIDMDKWKTEQNKWKTKDNSDTAYIIMKEFVKERLKSPASSIFPNINSKGVIVVHKENQLYIIESYVDSQNSFGAFLRSHFLGEIKQISDSKWELVSLEFLD